jgi:hypothetical protein
MMKRLLLILAVLTLGVPALAGTGNWIVNGDFENGLTGWQIGNFGPGLINPTVFDAAGEVPQSLYAGGSAGWATALAPKTGTSVGWARTGPGTAPKSYSFIYQIVECRPGTYTLDQSVTKWDVIAGCTEGDTRFAAMFLVRVDDQIGSPYDPTNPSTYALRATKWDFQDPKNAWFVKQFNNGAPASFTTTQGRVQFILAFEDHAVGTALSGYGYAAFDNVVFETNEEWVIPEPSSLLSLLTGMAGLAGFAIRRRK